MTPKMLKNNEKNNTHWFSSESNEWDTPQEFFDRLDKHFNFTLDPATNGFNSKCPKYYTEEEDGLKQSWAGETVFMNPPYGRDIKKWVEKAKTEAKQENTTVVALIPARTDTQYWHEHIFHEAKQIIFVKGRLKFGGKKNSAPLPKCCCNLEL